MAIRCRMLVGAVAGVVLAGGCGDGASKANCASESGAGTAPVTAGSPRGEYQPGCD